ncbi:hypothetical protein ACS0TY_025738 [Phlomoides rotata]
MASTGITVFQKTLSLPIYSAKCCKNHNPSLEKSQFLTPNSLLKLRWQNRHLSTPIKQLKSAKIHASPIISAAQSNFFKVIQTVWKVGRDGIEAGTNLVPDTVPRPIARISVAVVAVTLALFVLKSFISTAFIALAVMGVCYFTFIALNKDEGPKGGGETTSVDDSLEEARKIMDKYK